MSHKFPCEWQKTGICSKSFCRPRDRERAILLCAHTTIYRFYSPGLHRKSPLDCGARSTVCLRLSRKVAPRFDGRLYMARGPFKDLISRRGWIKIRTSSFLESKCIIVRFRTMVARTARRRKESLDCYYCCRCFRESH